jgi:hypothetical protein
VTTEDNEEWMTGGSQTSDPRFRELVAHTIDEVSDVIVEHRHYRGVSAPTRRVFGSMADFDKYMHEHARPGDRFVIWSGLPRSRVRHVPAMISALF